MVRVGDDDAIVVWGAIVVSALTLGESKFLKALDIETPNPPSFYTFVEFHWQSI